MARMSRTEDEELNDLNMKGRSHVVILGAGASRAALPDGDKNGKELPVMNDLIEVVGLGPILKSAGISYQGENFEVIYGSLSKDPDKKVVVEAIKDHIFDYFVQLQLPDQPTIYDHLVLSLREKDIIATFNWDPFLVQAHQRNSQFAPLPCVVFLHGNVGIGYCTEHKPIFVGLRGGHCSTCGRRLKNSPLLYPVEEKGYNEDLEIATAWKVLKSAMKEAYLFTVFGYGIPDSDVEAVDLLKEGWGETAKRELEETEIIDIRNGEELEELWSHFMYNYHGHTCKNFYDSFLAKHPRRSCEAMWAMLMDVLPAPERTIPITADFSELQAWFTPMIEIEQNSK